eukprot:m.1531036 g.1531036  ORF g.1531036 m.1531036 type:complete len:127 (-) comp25240_c0_seq48:3970-4350(-)
MVVSAWHVLRCVQAQRPTSGDGCRNIALALLYFLLATFSWMLVEGLHLFKSFVVVFQGKTDNSTVLYKYAIFAYTLPFFLVMIALGVTDNDDVSSELCWFHGDALWYVTVTTALTANLPPLFHQCC